MTHPSIYNCLCHTPEASVSLFLLWENELQGSLSRSKGEGAKDGLWAADPLEMFPEDLHHL